MSKKEREYKATIQEKDARIRELEDTSVANPSDMIYEHHVEYLYGSINSFYEHCHKDWMRLGFQPGFSSQEMDHVISEHHTNFLYSLLMHWSQWYPGDNRDSTTFATYLGLKMALVKAGLGNRARDLVPYRQLQTVKATQN